VGKGEGAPVTQGDGGGLDAQETAGTVAIWLTPASEGVLPSLSLLQLGGPKRFMRLWLDTRTVEWGWSLHKTAVLLWVMPGYEKEAAAIQAGAL